MKERREKKERKNGKKDTDWREDERGNWQSSYTQDITNYNKATSSRRDKQFDNRSRTPVYNYGSEKSQYNYGSENSQYRHPQNEQETLGSPNEEMLVQQMNKIHRMMGEIEMNIRRIRRK